MLSKSLYVSLRKCSIFGSLLNFPQLEEKVASLNRMIEDTNGELTNLLEQRDKENKEGDALITLLRSDVEHSKKQRLVHLRWEAAIVMAHINAFSFLNNRGVKLAGAADLLNLGNRCSHNLF